MENTVVLRLTDTNSFLAIKETRCMCLIVSTRESLGWKIRYGQRRKKCTMIHGQEMVFEGTDRSSKDISGALGIVCIHQKIDLLGPGMGCMIINHIELNIVVLRQNLMG